MQVTLSGNMVHALHNEYTTHLQFVVMDVVLVVVLVDNKGVGHL